jgi:hypothetical protein
VEGDIATRPMASPWTRTRCGNVVPELDWPTGDKTFRLVTSPVNKYIHSFICTLMLNVMFLHGVHRWRARTDHKGRDKDNNRFNHCASLSTNKLPPFNINIFLV